MIKGSSRSSGLYRLNPQARNNTIERIEVSEVDDELTTALGASHEDALAQADDVFVMAFDLAPVGQ